MDLQSLSDNELINRIANLAREEREILTKVLHHLREIDRRRLYSAFKYTSLFDFAVRRLGYSEDQAYRRISAMKLLREIPGLENKINAGEITLTHAGLAYSFFRQEKKDGCLFTSEMKTDVLEMVSNKTSRETERILLAMATRPMNLKKDRVTTIADEIIELRFVASNEVQAKLEHLKGLLAHRFPNISLGELLDMLCDLALVEWSVEKTAAPKKRRVTLRPSDGAPSPMKQASKVELRRRIFAKAESKCTNCGSRFALETDHIVPKGKGGTSEEENFRLLCRSCNQRAAVEAYGIAKMEKYWH
jgi:hypothetical protein